MIQIAQILHHLIQASHAASYSHPSHFFVPFEHHPVLIILFYRHHRARVFLVQRDHISRLAFCLDHWTDKVGRY